MSNSRSTWNPKVGKKWPNTIENSPRGHYFTYFWGSGNSHSACNNTLNPNEVRDATYIELATAASLAVRKGFRV